MRCNKARKNLTALIDGELDGKLRASVEEHLGRCEACQSERKALERVRDTMKSMEMPDLGSSVSSEAILRQVRSEERNRGKRKQERRGPSLPGEAPLVGLRPAIALAAGLAVVAMVWLVPVFRSIPLPTDQEIHMVESMELFENLDLIRDLSLLESLEIEEGQGGGLS